MWKSSKGFDYFWKVLYTNNSVSAYNALRRPVPMQGWASDSLKYRKTTLLHLLDLCHNRNTEDSKKIMHYRLVKLSLAPFKLQ